MRLEKFFEACEKHKLVAVLSCLAETAVDKASALVGKGVKIIEVTFRQSGAVEVIKTLAEKYKNSDVIIGAGTVLDPETARTAILAGAEFIVMPVVSEKTIKLCNRYSVACIPGIQTPNELFSALELGVDFVKLFPGNLAMLKALKGPFPNARFMITGGVTLANIPEWLNAGASALGASSLTPENASEWIKTTTSSNK